jgi:hypothetical protein
MKYLILVASTMLLAACQTPPFEQIPRPVVVQAAPIERPPLNLPTIDPLNARDVQWVVVTPNNVDEVFREMTARGQAPALFAVDEQGYENIAINTQESLRVILQQQSVIEGYREYYLVVNQRIAAHNQSVRDNSLAGR